MRLSNGPRPELKPQRDARSRHALAPLTSVVATPAQYSPPPNGGRACRPFTAALRFLPAWAARAQRLSPRLRPRRGVGPLSARHSWASDLVFAPQKARARDGVVIRLNTSRFRVKAIGEKAISPYKPEVAIKAPSPYAHPLLRSYLFPRAPLFGPPPALGACRRIYMLY